LQIVRRRVREFAQLSIRAANRVFGMLAQCEVSKKLTKPKDFALVILDRRGDPICPESGSVLAHMPALVDGLPFVRGPATFFLRNAQGHILGSENSANLHPCKFLAPIA